MELGERITHNGNKCIVTDIDHARKLATVLDTFTGAKIQINNLPEIDLTKLSNDQLGELYAGVIGYNPFHEQGAEPNETREYCIEVLKDDRFRSDIYRELKEIYIEVNGHTITRKGTTVFVHPGTTEWRGVKNKEDSYTELTEFDARKKMITLAKRIAEN